MADQPDNNADNGAKVIPFDYVKSNHFRVIHIDGAIGSLTSSGGLHLAFYSERPAIPQRQVFAVLEDGTLGEVLREETVSRQSVLREIDVDGVMTLETAKNLRDWLDQRLQEAALLGDAPVAPPSPQGKIH